MILKYHLFSLLLCAAWWSTSSLKCQAITFVSSKLTHYLVRSTLHMIEEADSWLVLSGCIITWWLFIDVSGVCGIACTQVCAHMYTMAGERCCNINKKSRQKVELISEGKVVMLLIVMWVVGGLQLCTCAHMDMWTYVSTLWPVLISDTYSQDWFGHKLNIKYTQVIIHDQWRWVVLSLNHKNKECPKMLTNVQ